MQRTFVETRAGRLRLTARNSASADRALEVALDAIESRRVAIGWVPWGKSRAYLKATPLRGNAAFRHTLRMAILRRPAPREREFQNLRWLSKRGLIGAVTPLAAGVLFRRGWARYQFLLTEELTNAQPLDEFLPRASAKERWQTYFEERGLERKGALLLLEDSRRYRDLFRAKLLRKPNERRGRPVPQEEWRVGALAPQ